MDCSPREDALGTVLLQSSLHIADHARAGQSLEVLQAESVEVPIGGGVLVAVVVLFCLLLLHELYVETGRKPLLARRDGSNSTLLQISIQLTWLLPTVSSTVVIPVCRDYAKAVGESATASGLLIGVVPLGALIGMLAGKGLVTENDWNQRYARKIVLYVHGLWIFSMPVMALIIRASVEWSPHGKRLSYWGVLSLYFLTVTIGSMMMVPWRTMWNLFTPQTDKTFWSMMTQCSKAFGFVGGPIFFAFVSFLVHGNQASQVSPISMMSWAFMGGFFINAIELLLAAAVFPTVLQQADCDSGQLQAGSDDELERAAGTRVERLNIVYYCYERGFTMSALEVSIILILQDSYGWTESLSGISFAIVGAGGIVMTGLSALLASFKWLTESKIFLSIMCLGACSSLLLFRLRFLGPISLLFAAIVLYGGASVANGIAEGWACRAATARTSYSIKAYLTHSMIGFSISRFAGPIIAGFLFDNGGQNLYAVAQSALCFLSAGLVYRTVSLVWYGMACED
ncbi:unnamed protein product [Symbiodinium sp. CCMP2592]|nr:unnamed protein product [Symbiodinium sp. CCMP2592]